MSQYGTVCHCRKGIYISSPRLALEASFSGVFFFIDFDHLRVGLYLSIKHMLVSSSI